MLSNFTQVVNLPKGRILSPGLTKNTKFTFSLPPYCPALTSVPLPLPLGLVVATFGTLPPCVITVTSRRPFLPALALSTSPLSPAPLPHRRPLSPATPGRGAQHRPGHCRPLAGDSKGSAPLRRTLSEAVSAGSPAVASGRCRLGSPLLTIQPGLGTPPWAGGSARACGPPTGPVALHPGLGTPL